MNTIIILSISGEAVPVGYIAGSFLFLLILCYLIYTLIKPEKF